MPSNQPNKSKLIISSSFGLHVGAGKSMKLTPSDLSGAKMHHAKGTTFGGTPVSSLSIATDGKVATLMDRDGSATAYDANDFELASRAFIVQRAAAAGIADIPSWLLV